MIENIKILLGDAATAYTDAQISLCYQMAQTEVESYCLRPLDAELELIAARIAIIKLNRIGTEGLVNQGYSGVNENYLNDYPADIQKALNRKRKVKII